MDLNYSAEETAFRDQVRGWLSENLPTELRDKVVNYREMNKEDLLRWHKILAKKGWVAPEWPREWGGTDWTVVERYIFEEEMGYAGAPPLIPFGLRMCAPVLLRFGTDAQKQPLPAADLPGRGLLVPGLFRARLGLRPRVAQDARGPAGRSLRRDRPEDLDHPGALRGLDLLPRAHRRPRATSARRASRSCSSTCARRASPCGRSS